MSQIPDVSAAHTMHSSVFTNYLQILMIRAIHLSLPETSDPDTKHCAVTDVSLYKSRHHHILSLQASLSSQFPFFCFGSPVHNGEHSCMSGA